MGKSVLGRLRVFLSSSGSAIFQREQIPFCTVNFPGETAGNIGKRCNYVCYNKVLIGVSRSERATNPGPSDIVPD